jgi:hypothetical protein
LGEIEFDGGGEKRNAAGWRVLFLARIWKRRGSRNLTDVRDDVQRPAALACE